GPRTENISKLDPMCFGIDGNLSIIVVNLLPKDGYSKARESYLKQKVFKNDPINYGTCMCCSKSDVLVEAPEPEVDFNSKKPFFTHPSMMPEGQKPIVICTECALKYAAFFRLMRNWKIKLLPLFVDPILQTKEIRLLNINGLNSFSQVFNQIGDATSLEFYLVLASSGELKYFDYVCNYDWKMDWSSFYKYNTPQKKITKRAFERKVCTAIGLNSLLYFESTKTVNKSVKVTLKKYLRNLLSEKIFNFVYRNKRDLIYSDILQLSVMPIEQLAYSSLNEFNKQINKQIRACLEIWFNHNNLIKVNRGDFVSIEDLRKSEHIDSPEVWAYYAGKSYRFLVFKRASGECLELEVIIRAHSAKNVKDAIIKKLEQRNHALSAEELNQFKLHMNELFAFDKFKGVDFKDLKPYFYAGYIDAIKLERKNGGDSNE
ncbi:hypothetical protein KKD40_00830, partial [Candidatus Micrarchaeota archaeon]|nr:hypothetical protein [Candidatus Micrarchaeota archaeon]